VLLSEVDRSISDRGDEVASAVRIGVISPTELRIALPQPNDYASADIFVQITSLDGTVLATSDNLGSLHLPVNPSALDGARGGIRGFETLDAGDLRMRVFYAPLTLAGHTVAVTQVARPLILQDRILAGLRLILAIGITLSVVVSAVVGSLLARAALRPIDRMTAAAEDIGQSRDFARRVTHPGPNDEVGRLAATFNSMLGQLETAYSELRAANARLEAALASQRRFTADASHELRTPLTTIRGNATLLRQFPEMAAVDRGESVDQIADEAERMGRLVQDLLVLARADAGIHMALQPMALAPLVREVYRQAGTLAREVELRLEDPDDIVVLGDRDYLKELLLILIDNALKYTPPGGHATLRCVQADGSALVTIDDTGAGIDPEDLPHIFERFYRASRARQTGGTGLGLSIAKWIVDEHHGSITVESRLGEGTTFAIRLPLAPSSDHISAPAWSGSH
jgi:two-component system, OmpR family, sensor kinase